MPTSRSDAGRAIMVLAMLGGSAAAGCGFEPPQQSPGEPRIVVDSPTPPPSWQATYAALTTDSARNLFLRDSLVAYGRSLEFDTVDGAGDEQQLPVDSLRSWAGPLMRIEPQVGIHALDDTLLGSGRVIARIINRSADSTYAPLRMLAADTAYWWVEQRASAGWVSAVVRSGAPAAGVLFGALQRTTHGTHRWVQPTARWVWPSPDSSYATRRLFGVALWGGCTGPVCCEASGIGSITEF